MSNLAVLEKENQVTQNAVMDIPAEKVNELTTNANDLLESAKGQGKISSPEQFLAVNDALVKIKDFKKQVTDLFKDPKAKAHEAHKAVCEAEKKLIEPAEKAEKQYGQLMIDYNREQDRLRREAEEKARREAEEKARQEREAVMKAAEEKMDTGASVEEIAELINQAETVVPVYVPPVNVQQVKPVGLNIRENWTYEITDIGLIPREYLMPNTVMLGQVARAMKGAANIPGVRVYDAGSVAKAR